ncbi:MAG: hypothetical protein DRQ88_10005 [Epsilonproteobacteria bacterium]|nr:MAG: hypothetical protein DRQ88_10005 [Campylobacterota bacterium]RLA65205.1 MAG: hypothetical protein DRQ89_01640 [Campylobacterota bacterium]
MKIISKNNDLNEYTDIAISMGNFDGVHLGHQRLLKNALKESKERGLTFGVITFIPHPLEVFKGVSDFYINSFEERRELLRGLGVDFIVELPFDDAFSKVEPQDFLNNYILTIKNLRKFFLGHDFGLGKEKKGDLKFISDFIKPHKLELHVEDEFLFNGHEVSSSKIRKLIKDGDIPSANSLLGREFFLSGKVVSGMGRGGRIGIPTMNLEFDFKRLTPGIGVYVTSTKVDGKLNLSLTNIGRNPTFEEDGIIKVETHLVDFNKMKYGENICVKFLEKIRDEKKFSGPDELVAQINQDIDYTKKKYL